MPCRWIEVETPAPVASCSLITKRTIESRSLSWRMQGPGRRPSQVHTVVGLPGTISTVACCMVRRQPSRSGRSRLAERTVKGSNGRLKRGIWGLNRVGL